MSKRSWAQRILRLRTRLNLTQVELAARLGVAPNTIALWERDHYTPQKLIQPAIERLEEEGGQGDGE
jgi:transcriptional regulator with XRE-family HTH domain